MSEEVKERRPVIGDSTLRWIFTLLFGAGMAYTSLSVAVARVPEIERGLATQAVLTAVLEERLKNIDEKVDKIYDLLKRSRRR